MGIRMKGQLRTAFIAMVLGVILLFSMCSTAIASTRDHNVPGKLMGTGGASGVVDATTNPQDVYAVQLFYGQSVTFKVSWNKDDWVEGELYAPGTTVIDDSNYVAGGIFDYGYGSSGSVTYVPAVTGVYYFCVNTKGNGISYTIAVSGSEGLPSNATVWSAGVSSGYSSSPTLGKSTWLHGVLTPGFNTNAPLLASTVQVQVSTDTVHWTTSQSLSRDGVFDVSVTPTSECWYRFYYAGDGGYAGSTSKTIHITPLRRSTTTARAGMKSVRHGKKFTLSGSVKPAESGDTCYLYVKKPRKARWTKVTTVHTSSKGTFSARVSYKTKGTYSFYVYFRGSSDLAASLSKTFKVKVK